MSDRKTNDIHLTREQAEALASAAFFINRDDIKALGIAALDSIREQLHPKRVEPTPGPWVVTEYPSSVRIDADGKNIVLDNSYDDIDPMTAEDSANARLIAAAPRFLEWAKRMIDNELPMEPGDEDAVALRAIVADVYGEES